VAGIHARKGVLCKKKMQERKSLEIDRSPSETVEEAERRVAAEKYRKKWNKVHVGDEVNILTEGGPLKGTVKGFREERPADGEVWFYDDTPAKYVVVDTGKGQYEFIDNPDEIVPTEEQKKDDTAWEKAQKEDTEIAYRRYLDAFPHGTHRSEAWDRVHAIEKGEREEKKGEEKEKEKKKDNKFTTDYQYDQEMKAYGIEGTLKEVKDGVAIYVNKEGQPCIIMAAKDDHTFIGIFRETGSNKWSLKMENQSGDKEFGKMIGATMNQLPTGSELYERTNISVDGLRIFAQQLDHGFEIGNENYETSLNGADKGNLFNASQEDRDDMASLYIEGENKEDKLQEVREKLKPYLEKFGVRNVDNVVTVDNNGKIRITLPVLVKTENGEAVTETADIRTERAKKAKAAKKSSDNKIINNPIISDTFIEEEKRLNANKEIQDLLQKFRELDENNEEAIEALDNEIMSMLPDHFDFNEDRVFVHRNTKLNNADLHSPAFIWRIGDRVQLDQDGTAPVGIVTEVNDKGNIIEAINEDGDLLVSNGVKLSRNETLKAREDKNKETATINELRQRLYKQMLAQFKEMGIPVHNKEEMEAFLKEHGYDDIEELAKAYSRERPYQNKKKATKAQRDSLIEQVKSKDYQANGTDVLKVGNSLFLVDVMPQIDLEEYYPNGEIPDGQGYGIRKRYDLNKVTENDVKEIIRNISVLYGFDYERINNVLQSIGITKRHLSKSAVNAAIESAKRDAAKGNGRSRRFSGDTQGNGESENLDGSDRRRNQRGDKGDGVIQAFIGKKARLTYRDILRKHRPEMTNLQIEQALDFLHSLEDNKENTAFIKVAVKWIANTSMRLPQDLTIARQLFDIARKNHIDLSKFKTMGEVIQSDEYKATKEKNKPKFDPDKAKTFSNKQTVTTAGGRVFTVYDVEDTEEGQREVCKALAAHYKVSPWCLSTFTGTGEPT